MTMTGNDDNVGIEGNDGIEDIDVSNTFYILLPYPDASAYALAPYSKAQVIFLKASATHWHYIGMKKSKIFR